MKNKPKSSSLNFQLAVGIASLIIIIEGILLVFSYYSKERELQSIVKSMGHENCPKCLEGKDNPGHLNIQKRLQDFTRNIILLTLLIVVFTVGGTLLIFRWIAGRHILKLDQLNKETSLDNLLLYPEEKIPNNEIGDIIRSRDQMLKEITSAQLHLLTLGKIAANISNEINTPLFTISSKAENTIKGIQEGLYSSEKVLGNLEKIKETSLRMGHIIQGIHTISRNADQVEKVEVSIDKLLKEVLEIYDEKYTEEIIPICLEVEEDKTLRCHSYQIVQVLSNLVSNARDAIKDNQEKWIKIEVRNTPQNILIFVKDSGDGLRDKTIDDISKAFYTTKKEYGGTGLGLGLVRDIIQKHGGNISLDKSFSTTVFKIELPYE